MDAITPVHAEHDMPLEFTGRAGRYFELALGNLLLTIITIGIYRFWAKTRVRCYLWENTHFMGEPLEYRGRGIEKLIGALIVLGVVIVPIFLIGLVAVAMPGLGSLVILPAYVAMFYLLGVGIYRSQRYMFSRTSWRGIRGGMSGNGWAYGWLFLRMLLLQAVTLGLTAPYAAVRLWNARMNDAMFGSIAVTADAQWRPLFRRFLPAWLGALVVYAAMLWLMLQAMMPALAAVGAGGKAPVDPEALKHFAQLYAVLIGGMILIGLMMLGYHAAMLREVFGATRLGSLGLGMTVTGRDLLMFSLGNLALIVFTFGFGLMMMPYRTYGFYARRLVTNGTLDTDHLLQTRLAAPVQGDGLADAFDVSSF